ncbi:glycoside hydrolase family 108 protein [Dryocola sp. BD626]|uniref:glycoside hydrolase family 108 protein n=1 Tax=Dryocola sp. BD626 TaxID=3133273 RepID=UPI003F505595
MNNPVIDGILTLEGGYVNNPADKGGATHWGITESTARAHGFKGDMRELTRDEAYSIIEQDYWIKPGFDKLAQLSLPLAFKLCDAGVNIGPAYPGRWLQQWLNLFNKCQKKYADITVDGALGQKTMQALQAFLSWRGKEGEEVLLKAINCSQGHYYLSITEKREANEEFIYGWLKERVTIEAR